MQDTFTSRPQPMTSGNPGKTPQGCGNWNMETSAPLTVKDLGIIKDELNREAMAYKKWSIYSGYFQDSTLRNMATQTAEHHKQHFDCLQNYLNGHQ